MKKLVIIDSYALAHRAFYALPPLVSPNGILVNAVYGFLLIFLKIIKEINPDYIVAAFDVAGPTFRHREYRQYKAKRIKAPEDFYRQIDIIKDFLRAFQVPILEKKGYEADDIIGSLVKQLKNEKDLEIIIATGDLDTLQLVSDKVKVYTLRKGMGDTIIYDEKKVKERYGLLPSQLIDFKALKGDPSDNIPGVPGIGEKTAIKLIQEFHNLDNLYRQLEEGKAGLPSKLQKKLKDNKEIAYFSRHLVEINQDLGLDFQLKEAQRVAFSPEKIQPLLEKWGFRSLKRKMFNSVAAVSSDTPALKMVNDSEKSEELVQEIEKCKEIGILPDYQGEGYSQRVVKGLGLALEKKLYYLPQNIWEKFSKENIQWSKKKLITHNAKILYQGFFIFQDVLFEDVQIISWLLDPERKQYSLENLADYYLQQEVNSQFSSLLNILTPLYHIVEARLESLDLDKIYQEIEKPLIPVLAQMEKIGILIDSKELSKLKNEANREIAKLKQKIFALAGQEFNLNSPLQLSQVLFEKLELPTDKLPRTPGGRISTDFQTLSLLKEKHPIIDYLLKYRSLEKLRTSFLEILDKFINPHDKRIHTSFKQTGTATGRLSSENPNLQNIPAQGEWGRRIRKIFIAEKSFLLCSLDYSQIELRLAAHLSQDSLMKSIFLEGKDIHSMTASYIFRLPPEKITPKMRRLAKILNFGILYGMSDKSFALTSGLSLSEARQFREKYFSQFIGLKLFLDNILSQAKQLGYVETLLGRKRFLPLIKGHSRRSREEERMALNMPFQGLAADLLKLAMIKISQWIKENNMKEEVRMLLQIHDELLFEVKSDLIKEVLSQLKKIMENVYPLSVPLKVNVKIGPTWGELKNYEKVFS